MHLGLIITNANSVSELSYLGLPGARLLSQLTHELEASEFPGAWLGDVDRVGANVAVDVAARHVEKSQGVCQLEENSQQL